MEVVFLVGFCVTFSSLECADIIKKKVLSGRCVHKEVIIQARN